MFLKTIHHVAIIVSDYDSSRDFYVNKLGFEIEDDELIISRHFYRNSKSKITVNGMRMTVSKLKELMRNVLDLVGQHEHQYLLNKNYHLGLLDRFLDKNGQELAKEIRNNVSSLKMINKKIKAQDVLLFFSDIIFCVLIVVWFFLTIHCQNHCSFEIVIL